jgi:regulator of protease activity HflC (stomatin/prohibitin superfamily)
VAGQEIMTREKIPVRINFYCQYKVEDVMKIHLAVAEYEKQFYILLQLALREYIGSLLLDEILGKKTEVEQYIHTAVSAKAQELGLAVTGSGIKDIILPGDIKDIINQVLIAEKKAQANVIMRREETASTRSLLNTAKLMEENKTLYQLKELEYIERISEKISQLSINGNGTQILEELKRLFLPR